jgi:hypothetical protein
VPPCARGYRPRRLRGRAPSTISQALSPPAQSRYAGTLREIVEHFTEYRVVTKNAHHIEN